MFSVVFETNVASFRRITRTHFYQARTRYREWLVLVLVDDFTSHHSLRPLAKVPPRCLVVRVSLVSERVILLRALEQVARIE